MCQHDGSVKAQIQTSTTLVTKDKLVFTCSNIAQNQKCMESRKGPCMHAKKVVSNAHC